MGTNTLFLVADDDTDDIILLEDAIHSIDENIKIDAAMDGRAAMNYLADAKKTGHLPNVLILDINMPVLNGKEVIALIKSDIDLQDLPIVIFSTSSYHVDMDYFRQYNVDFITKPFGMDIMMEIAKKLVTEYSS